MTKKKLFVLLAFSCGLMQAQVGINTVDPKATLHVVPTKTDQSTAEGIIAPNLTRGELISKDPKYTIDQRGAIVYVTTIDGIATTKTANILTAGYYFFDGNLWQIFSSGGADIPAEPWRVQGSNTEATSNSENIYQTGSVAIGSNSAGTYKFQVTGNSNITGDSRAGSSTVTGNLNVSKTSTLTGNVGIGGAAGTQKIYITSGGTSAKPVAAVKIIDGNQADGKVLSSDASGIATWQSLPATASTEPWQIQGGTALSTSNTENIYQTGSVAVGSNSAGTYKLQVTGTSNITDDSRVGSSTVVGNETVGGTLAVTGATALSNALTVSGTSSLSATNIGGALNYKPGDIAPTANNYLRTDESGNATWQSLPATANTEPWQIQGDTALSTSNTENIYQTGSVAIGSNSAGTYKLQVTGTSNITDDSRVGSSTVVGNETVGGTLAVTGATALSNALTVSGTSSLSATNIGGALNYKPGDIAPTANNYLRTDESGNATWQSLPATANTEPWQIQGDTALSTSNTENIYQTGSVAIGSNSAGTYKLQVTGTSNITDDSRVGSSTVVGNETVGGTLAVTGNSTLTGNVGIGAAAGAQKIYITSGGTSAKPVAAVKIIDGNQADGKVLSSDASGIATWQSLPATASTEPWQVQGGTSLSTSNTENIYQTGSVAVGSNSAGTYKFQVTGTSNITGNSRVGGSSTVEGNETVSGSLTVTSNSRVGSSTVVANETVGGLLAVTGNSTLTGNVGIGALATSSYKLQVTGTSYVTSNSYIGGNLGVGTINPSQKIHLVGNQYTTGLSKIGGNTTITSSAQLELADSNKAFLPNRVALNSSTDIVTVPNPVEGMIVYNTNATADMPIGLSYYNGKNWTRLVTRLPESTINLLDLQSICTSTANDATQTQKGAVMNVGSITIPENGSYAFAFRLYGSLKTKPPVANMIFYYIALLSNGVLQDTAEMDIIAGSNDNANFLSYSVTLGATLKAGDVVTFRLSHNSASNYPWALIAQPGQKRADRTSMVWWKL